MQAGVIRVELELDDGRFTSRLVRAGSSLTDLQRQLGGTVVGMQRLDNATLRLGDSIHKIVTTVGLAKAAMSNLWGATGGWISSIVKTNAELERMQALMKGMSTASTNAGASKEAKDNVSWIFDFAKTAPVNIAALNDAFVKLKSGGIDPLGGSMRALVDANAAFGGNSDTLHRAAIAIQQMAGKGVVSMEELRQQLGEAVPSAMKLMAQSAGMSMADFTKQVSTGTVEAKSALDHMFAEFRAEFGGRGAEMMTTFTGMLEVFQTKWIQLQAKIGQGGGGEQNGFFATVKDQLSDIVTLMDDPRMGRLGGVLGESLKSAILTLREVALGTARWREEIGAVGSTIAIMFVGSRLLGFLGDVSRMIAQQVMQWRVYSASTAAAFGEVRRGIGLFSQVRTAQDAMAAASLTAGAAVTTLGRAFSLLGGPVGMAVMFLGTLAYELGVFESRAARAQEAWESLQRGLYTDEQIKRAKEDLAIKEESVSTLEKMLKINQDGLAKAKALGAGPDVLADYEARIADYEARANAAREEASKKKVLLAQTEAERIANIGEQAATREARRIDEGTSERRRVFAEQRSLVNDWLNEESRKVGDNEEKKKELQKQAFESRRILAEQFYGDEIAKLEAERSKAEEGVRNAQNDTDKAGAASLLKRIRDSLGNLKDERDAFLKNIGEIRLNKSDEDEGLKKAENQANQFATAMMNAKARLAELQAQIKGGNGKEAKIDGKLDNGWLEEARKRGTITKKQVEELKAVYAEIGKSEDMLNHQQKMEKTFGAISDVISRAKERLEEYEAALINPATAQFGTDYANMVARMNKAIADTQLNGSPEEIMKVQRQAAEAQQVWMDQHIAGQAVKWHEANTQGKVDLAQTEDEKRALRQQAADEEVRRIDELVAKFQGSEEAKVQITREAEERKSQILKAAQEQNKGPIQRMFDQWKDFSARMEEAGARWIDSFTDKLVDMAVTGKATFTDFAESVLRDILRMQYQAAIAKTFGGGILDGLGSWIGSMFGGSSVVPGSAADPNRNQVLDGLITSAGESAAPHVGGLYHSGGLVGLEPTSFRQVSASMFKGAKKFHTGGFPGLRSDEVPAILKKGEGVFTPEQMKALGGMSQGNMNLQINLINQTGGGGIVAEQGQPRFDGEQMVLDIVLRAASRPGSFRDGMKGALA